MSTPIRLAALRASRRFTAPQASATKLFSTAASRLAEAPSVEPVQSQVQYPPSSDPQLEGYPDVPATSYQLRRPKGWTDIQERRNFGEVVPEEYEALSMWTPDPPVVATRESAIRQFGVAVMGFVIFAFAVKVFAAERPALPRDYPHDGLREELGGLEANKAFTESLEGDD